MSLPPANPIRYAIYTSQSVEKLDDLTSCQVQFQVCKDFAEAEGAPHACWIGEHFDDEGYSGMNLDRPGMSRLRELINARGIDVLYYS